MLVHAFRKEKRVGAHAWGVKGVRGVRTWHGTLQTGCGVSNVASEVERGLGCRKRGGNGVGVGAYAWGGVLRGRVETRGWGSRKGVGGLKGGAGGSRRVAGARRRVLVGPDVWLGLANGCWASRRVAWGLKRGGGGLKRTVRARKAVQGAGNASRGPGRGQVVSNLEKPWLDKTHLGLETRHRRVSSLGHISPTFSPYRVVPPEPPHA